MIFRLGRKNCVVKNESYFLNQNILIWTLTQLEKQVPNIAIFWSTAKFSEKPPWKVRDFLCCGNYSEQNIKRTEGESHFSDHSS